MKKEYLLVIILGIIILALLGVVVFLPAKKGGEQQQNQDGQSWQKGEGIEIYSPIANTEIDTPVKITGQVTGSGWAGFEGQVGTVKLVDYKGNVLGQTYLKTTTEWTQLPTKFEAEMIFIGKNAGTATLVFRNENPSGDAERDKTFNLPVKISQAATEKMNVKVFYGLKNNGNTDCSIVFPVDRQVKKTEAPARAAIEELLKGPTDAEESASFFTSINPGVKIQSLKIEKGTAYVDFDEQLQKNVGGSCKVSSIRAQITQTLKQFPTVKNVVISIDGRTEDILQP